MHEERCKADAAQGRASGTLKVGMRLAEADVEGKERAMLAGVMYARQDAAAYEARCLLAPGEEKAREAERLRREAKAAAVDAAAAVERAALVEQRIETGELVEAKKAGGGSVGAAGGGWEWATQSERQVMERLRGEGGAGVEIEMGNTGGGAVALAQNVSAGALDEFCAGSRVVRSGPAKKARVEK